MVSKRDLIAIIQSYPLGAIVCAKFGGKRPGRSFRMTSGCCLTQFKFGDAVVGVLTDRVDASR
jgi:hypothetical protein